jgi:Spy/CpxP family protein refolding chaperone
MSNLLAAAFCRTRAAWSEAEMANFLEHFDGIGGGTRTGRQSAWQATTPCAPRTPAVNRVADGVVTPSNRNMKMSRKLFICLTLSLLPLLWPSPAHAQRFRWWVDEKFQKELVITPDQQARIEACFQAAQPALRAQQRALSKLEDELSKMVLEANIDESEVEHFVTKVEAARADLGKTRTMMIFRMRRILTTEQHVKLQKLFEQYEKDRRGKGHGE